MFFDREKLLKFQAEGLFKQRKDFETECFINLFLEISQILYIRKIQTQIGKNKWNSETYRKS